MVVTTRSQTKQSRVPLQTKRSHVPLQKCLPIVTPQKAKGFKLMSSKMCGYNGFQYKKGKTYTLPEGEEPILCARGFHFCEKSTDCLLHVPHLNDGKPLRLFNVEAQGVVSYSGDKSAAKSITIGKEIKDLSMFDGAIQHSDGSTCTYKNFRFHSEDDQPAYISRSGNIKMWYINGKPGRKDDKPHYISSYEQRWYDEDERTHRDGGMPAVVNIINGHKEYFCHGVEYFPKL